LILFSTATASKTQSTATLTKTRSSTRTGNNGPLLTEKEESKYKVNLITFYDNSSEFRKLDMLMRIYIYHYHPLNYLITNKKQLNQDLKSKYHEFHKKKSNLYKSN